MKKLLSLMLGLLFIAVFIRYPSANSQEIPPNTITINPAYVDLTLNPGQPNLKYDIKITNTTKDLASLNVSAIDLKGLDETGGLLFGGSGGEGFAKKYGIANWISSEPSSVSISPGQSKTVKITITNKEDLSPGGHYGSILFKTTSTGTSKENTQVNLNPSLTSTIFLSKLGGEKYDLNLKQISTKRNVWSILSKATVSFSNPGNTHNTPRGVVELIDPSGKTVSEGTINLESGRLLPQTERNFDVPLNKIKRAFIPGNYKVRVSYHYDGYEPIATKEITVVYIGVLPILIVTLFLAVLVLIYKKIRERSRRMKRLHGTENKKT